MQNQLEALGSPSSRRPGLDQSAEGFSEEFRGLIQAKTYNVNGMDRTKKVLQTPGDVDDHRTEDRRQPSPSSALLSA